MVPLSLKKKKKNYSAAQVLRGGSQDLLVTVCRLFQLRHAEDLVPRSGIEPRPAALGMRSLNPWATREVPHMPLSPWCFPCPSFSKCQLIKPSSLQHSLYPCPYFIFLLSIYTIYSISMFCLFSVSRNRIEALKDQRVVTFLWTAPRAVLVGTPYLLKEWFSCCLLNIASCVL